MAGQIKWASFFQPKGWGSIIKRLLGNNQAQEIHSSSVWQCCAKNGSLLEQPRCRCQDLRNSPNKCEWHPLAYQIESGVRIGSSFRNEWHWYCGAWPLICVWALEYCLSRCSACGRCVSLGSCAGPGSGLRGPLVPQGLLLSIHSTQVVEILSSKALCKIQVKWDYKGGHFGFCCLKYVVFTNNKYF